VCHARALQVNTGDWKKFQSFGAPAMRIPAGKQVLTVCFDDVSGFELESIGFAQQRTDAPTAKPVKPTIKPTVKPTAKPKVVPVEEEEAPSAKAKPATVAEPEAVAPQTPAPTPKATKAVPTAAPTAAKRTGQYCNLQCLRVIVSAQ
jgi:outer membrane biosynthesis protein TonB